MRLKDGEEAARSARCWNEGLDGGGEWGGVTNPSSTQVAGPRARHRLLRLQAKKVELVVYSLRQLFTRLGHPLLHVPEKRAHQARNQADSAATTRQAFSLSCKMYSITPQSLIVGELADLCSLLC